MSLKELDSTATYKVKLKTFKFARAFDLDNENYSVCFHEFIHV